MYTLLYADDLAEMYLLARPDDRIEYSRILIRYQKLTVGPLVNSIILITNYLFRMIQGKTDLPEEPRQISPDIVDPIIDAAYIIIQKLGEIGLLEVCSMLSGPSRRIQIVAGLLLLKFTDLNLQYLELIESILQKVSGDVFYENLVALMVLILGKAGNARMQANLARLAQVNEISIKDLEDEIRYRVLNELVDRNGN